MSGGANVAAPERTSGLAGEQWSEFLTKEEIRDLTQARGLVAQQAMLTAHGLPHRVVRSRLLVSRQHVRDWLRGVVVTPSRGVRLDLVK